MAGLRASRWMVAVVAAGTWSLCAVLARAEEPVKPPSAPVKADPKALEFFEKRVRPVLLDSCMACHTGTKAQGALRMDSPAAFFKGGPSGPLVVPGDPEKSLLIQAVLYTKDHLKMPPKGKLKPNVIADLTEWVKMGAPWPNYTGAAAAPAGPKPGPGSPEMSIRSKHWSFQAMKLPALPAVKDKAWVKSPIDAFVLARLEAKGLKPAPKADKRTLIRRVTFDLTGLPPTPAEIDAFLADASPNALEKVVDRLLASPAYGERWARHWLDVARYADSNGLDENTAFANAWRYRDYVVNSLNRDKPYDEFIREQIAGDLIAPAKDWRVNAERLTATGFLSLGPKVLAEPDKDKMVMDIVDEQVDTVGRAVMGLTLGCARCHDHKFDPLPTQDYYSLAGIFKSTRTMKTLNTVAQVLQRPLPDEQATERQAEHQKELAKLEAELKTTRAEADAQALTTVLRDLPKYLLAALHVSPASLSAVPGTADPARPGAIVLEVEKFTRGDVQVTRDGYGEGIGIVESAGRSAAFTEFDFEAATAGDYDLFLRYASGEERPVRVSLDGKLLKADAARRGTGGFYPRNQTWEAIGIVPLTAGKHTLRVQQNASSLPHLDKVLLALVPKGAAASGRRTETVEALAQSRNLNPELLRNVALHLDAARTRGVDSPFDLLLKLSDIPDTSFGSDAPRLVGKWQTEGRRLHPQVAVLFSDGNAPSLADAAGRYAALLTRVQGAWSEASRAGKQRLDDAHDETLRAALYGAQSGFGLERLDRLYPSATKTVVGKLASDIDQLKKAGPSQGPIALAVEDMDKIENVKVHVRGNHLTLGEEAPRRFLRVISGNGQTPISEKRSGRMELAEWLTRPDHPLTSRVIVNRLWQHHFGEGIVRSPDNFGLLGDKPTHPELLDWLAVTFAASPKSEVQSPRVASAGKSVPQSAIRIPHSAIEGMGWSLKRMHRLMVLSNSYQMSTVYDAKSALADPENRLLWRAHRRRMEVEAIRDSILAVSGELDRKMGGSLLTTPDYGYVTNDQSGNGAAYDAPRRSLYLPVIRNAVYDVFQVFDFVEPSVLNGKRANTTVAPQALFLLNGAFVIKQAKAFAETLLQDAGKADSARVQEAYVRAYGRAADATEVKAALDYVAAYEQRLAAKEPEAGKRRLAAWSSLAQVVFASSEFVYVN